MRTAKLICTILVVAHSTLYTAVSEALADEFVTEVLFADSTYIARPLTIESETVSFLKVRFYQALHPNLSGRPGLLPRQSLRYLVYEDWAVPYRDGVAQSRIKVSRTKHYPKSGLLLFGLASFATSAWLHLRSQDAAKSFGEIGGVGTAEVKRRHGRRRERFELYSGLAFVTGFGLSITGLTWETIWKMDNGDIVLPRADGRYQTLRDMP